MQSEKTSLYFKQGSSDKVYNASIEKVDDNRFVVNFSYGRRGATLNTGTKTKIPVDYVSARKIFDTLVKSKTSKGYTPGLKSPQYVHTDADTKNMNVKCQLLNFIEASQVDQFINDEDWWAQEKHDGKRMLIRKADTVTAINRQGFSIGAPEAVLNSADRVEKNYLMDGESVGERLFAFDILEIDDTNIRGAPYSQRLSYFENLFFGSAVVVVETAKTKEEKQQLYDRLKSSNSEGIIFKKHSAPYTAGRPSRGGNQVKFKFYSTASVIVTKINDKRSVAVSVIAGDNQIGVGNVTIPPNKEVPTVNSIIEVRYLYAYKKGSLYQPNYLSVRDDLKLEDCSISQLKYKKDTL
jgi:bifunctional non-homologous end joining protein LigD